MSERPNARAAYPRIGRILFTLAVAAALSGCDRCGDWWPPIKFESQACRDEAPRPQ